MSGLRRNLTSWTGRRGARSRSSQRDVAASGPAPTVADTRPCSLLPEQVSSVGSWTASVPSSSRRRARRPTQREHYRAAPAPPIEDHPRWLATPVCVGGGHDGEQAIRSPRPIDSRHCDLRPALARPCPTHRLGPGGARAGCRVRRRHGARNPSAGAGAALRCGPRRGRLRRAHPGRRNPGPIRARRPDTRPLAAVVPGPVGTDRPPSMEADMDWRIRAACRGTPDPDLFFPLLTTGPAAR